MTTQLDQAGQIIQTPAPNPPSDTRVKIIGSSGQQIDATMVGGIATPIKGA